MSAFISKLKEDTEREAATRECEVEQQVATARERLTPLKDRLERLLASIPLEVQREGLSLTAVQAMLRGRWRGRAHPGEVGDALRAAGFSRRRNWSDGGSFRSLWFRNDDLVG